MKTTILLLVTLVALGGTFTEALARGQNVSLAPVATVLLPDDQSGMTEVVLRFDLSGACPAVGLGLSLGLSWSGPWAA